MDPTPSSFASDKIDLFDDRYGAGARQRLLALFARPCLTFAEIGERFGVTRERVRQWHQTLLPDAPRGHARQRLCWAQQQRRRLLADPLFRAFYKDARLYFSPDQLVLVRGRDRFHKREVVLNGRLVALRTAVPLEKGPDGQPRQWALRNASHRADFIYYRLEAQGFVVVPRRVIPSGGATVTAETSEEWNAFRNSFTALLSDALRQRAS